MHVVIMQYMRSNNKAKQNVTLLSIFGHLVDKNIRIPVTTPCSVAMTAMGLPVEPLV